MFSLLRCGLKHTKFNFFSSSFSVPFFLAASLMYFLQISLSLANFLNSLLSLFTVSLFPLVLYYLDMSSVNLFFISWTWPYFYKWFGSLSSPILIKWPNQSSCILYIHNLLTSAKDLSLTIYTMLKQAIFSKIK